MKNIKHYGIAMLLIAHGTSLKADVPAMFKEGEAASQSSAQLLESAQRGDARQARQAIQKGAILEAAHDGKLDAFDIALEKSFILEPDVYDGSPIVIKINNRYAQVAKLIAPQVGNMDTRIANFKDLKYKDDPTTDQAIDLFKSLKRIHSAQ